MNVHVSDHSFGIFDRNELPIDTANWSNGLIVVMSIGASIYTGIDRGYVRVTTDIRSDAPGEIHPGPWDDIVEASIYSAHGELRIDSPERGAVAEIPLLSPRGPGSYRLRAHVRGRDLHYDAVQNDPSEDYLLTIWPAEPEYDLIVRATDQCGYRLRLSDARRARASRIARKPRELVAEEQHRATLRDALLRGATKTQPTSPPAGAP